MSSLPRILLTNDDGIQATGLASVKDALSTVADVTVIAPQLNQSGSSRSNSRQFDVEKHDEGYAVAGTPVDCVHFGYGYLDKDFDIVVSGCNDAPNIGAHKIERSGTVGAAIEAGFLGLPGLALSLYDHPDGTRDFSRDDYSEAQKTAKFLVSQLDRQSIPEAFDYFNVNIPASPPDPPLRITEPVFHFDIRVDETANGEYEVWDHFYDPLEPSIDTEVTDPRGTDRRAVADEAISVSPLSVQHQTITAAVFEQWSEQYD